MESHRGRGGARGGRHSGGRDVQISKALTYILRHGAADLKLSIRTDGYVPLNEVMNVPSIKCNFSEVLWLQ